jgi:hypothetical protein
MGTLRRSPITSVRLIAFFPRTLEYEEKLTSPPLTAWDLRSKALYCYGCRDYARSTSIKRLVVAEELSKAERAQEKIEGRGAHFILASLTDAEVLTDHARAVSKRKRISMSQAEFSTDPSSSLAVAGPSSSLPSSCSLLIPSHAARGIRNLGNR